VEILASIDDVNAYLPSSDVGGNTSGYPVVVEATMDNTALLQVSTARVIRGYLSSMITSDVLMSWATPDTTPDIIREAAAKMIAANLYFNHSSRTSLTIEENSFAQRRYDQAMYILDRILAGTIIVVPPDGGGVTPLPPDAMSDEDYFPVDDTDRAFSMSMEL
jgi:hypothetical protein